MGKQPPSLKRAHTVGSLGENERSELLKSIRNANERKLRPIRERSGSNAKKDLTSGKPPANAAFSPRAAREQELSAGGAASPANEFMSRLRQRLIGVVDDGTNASDDESVFSGIDYKSVGRRAPQTPTPKHAARKPAEKKSQSSKTQPAVEPAFSPTSSSVSSLATLPSVGIAGTAFPVKNAKKISFKKGDQGAFMKEDPEDSRTLTL